MSNNQMVLAPRELLERLDLGKNMATALSALPELRELLSEAPVHLQAYPSEEELIANGLGYPIGKMDAVKLHYAGVRSPVITVLEAWEAIGHDTGINPDKQELMESLRNMAAICAAHGFDMPAEQHQGEPLLHLHPEVVAMLRGERKQVAGGLTYSGSSPVGGWTVPLFTHADPAEVERLVSANTEYARQHLEQVGEVDRLREALTENKKEYRELEAQVAEDFKVIDDLRAKLAELKQAFGESQEYVVRRGKLLAERDALLREAMEWVECDEDPMCAKSRMSLIERVSALSASAEPAKSEKPRLCTSCDGCQGFETGHNSREQMPYSIRCDNCRKEARAHEYADLAAAWNLVNSPASAVAESSRPKTAPRAHDVMMFQRKS